MISFCMSEEAPYYPADSSFFIKIFEGVGGLTKKLMPPCTLEKSFILKHPSYFNFSEIEDAFDCEFVVIPDTISSKKDFRKWLMETSFE